MGDYDINRESLEYANKKWAEDKYGMKGSRSYSPFTYGSRSGNWYDPWSGGRGARPAPVPSPPSPERPEVLYGDSMTEEKKVRGLYKVYIVDPEFDLVVYEGMHIAADDGAAKIRGAVKAVLDKDIDDYDIVVVRLGPVRDKAEINAQLIQTAMLDRLGTVERRAPQLKEAIEKGTRAKNG